MTAWAYIICEKMGFDRLEALSLGESLNTHPYTLSSRFPGSVDVYISHIDETCPRPREHLRPATGASLAQSGASRKHC
jgi:hypothetical protein